MAMLGLSLRLTPFLPRMGVRWSSTLGDLAPAAGSTRQQTRVGRGPGSGRGKTAGRGTKGQKARHGVHSWFEGGQTPITKIFPKVGFKSVLERPAEINLGDIQRLIDQKRLDPSVPITMRELFKSKGVTSTASLHGIKILGRGGSRLRQPITLSATRATRLAIERIEELGGKFTAQYYTPLGMRALTRPEATLAKYGRLPLRAQPVDRRNIEFYRSEASRGYLVGTPGAPEIRTATQRGPAKAENPLAARLRELEAHDPSVTAVHGFEASRVV